MTLKIKTLLSIAFCFLSVSVVAQNSNRLVEEIIQREMKERQIPGLQIAVVQKGKIVYSNSFGIANLQDNIAVDKQSVFAINSITKVFTGVAIMQLVEKGFFQLSDPVSKDLNILPAHWQTATINQLLTHTSGFPDILKMLGPTGGLTTKNEAEEWEKLKALPMDFTPGEKFSYNQTNGYLLGKLIDKYSGQPFADNFATAQFAIAGMKHTLFGDSRDVIPHFAPTYFWRKYIDGQKLDSAKLINNYYEFPYFRRAAAGLNSTAEDMANWVIALESGKLLQSKSLEKMWSPSQFKNGKTTPWTLGWGMNKFRDKYRAVGMSGGGRAAFLVYPDNQLAVIVLTNLGGSYPEDFLEEIAGVYNPEIPKADPVTNLRLTLRKIGYDKAIPFTEKEMKENALFRPNEFEINEWAYRMLAKEQFQEAKEIFKLNVHLFPNSGNVYDSYGEVLLKMGDKKQAIEMYKKAIELDPNNTHAIKILEELDK